MANIDWEIEFPLRHNHFFYCIVLWNLDHFIVKGVSRPLFLHLGLLKKWTFWLVFVENTFLYSLLVENHASDRISTRSLPHAYLNVMIHLCVTNQNVHCYKSLFLEFWLEELSNSSVRPNKLKQRFKRKRHHSAAYTLWLTADQNIAV